MMQFVLNLNKRFQGVKNKYIDMACSSCNKKASFSAKTFNGTSNVNRNIAQPCKYTREEIETRLASATKYTREWQILQSASNGYHVNCNTLNVLLDEVFV